MSQKSCYECTHFGHSRTEGAACQEAPPSGNLQQSRRSLLATLDALVGGIAEVLGAQDGGGAEMWSAAQSYWTLKFGEAPYRVTVFLKQSRPALCRLHLSHEDTADGRIRSGGRRSRFDFVDGQRSIEGKRWRERRGPRSRGVRPRGKPRRAIGNECG